MLRAALKILNEEAYLHEMLLQFYSHVDEILIVEGCDSYMRKSTKRATNEGLSTDGTAEIIRNFPDPGGKIEYVPMGFYQEEDEAIQRFMLGLKAGDVLWSASPDEFFFQDDICKVKEYMEVTSCLTMTFAFLTYWHDFYHLLRGGGWDNRLARVFRLTEDASEMSIISRGATLRDKFGRTYNDAFYSGTLYNSGIQDHHFSYVRTAEKILEKLCWQLEIEEGWDSVTKDSPIVKSVAGSLDVWSLKNEYKIKEAFVSRTMPFFTNEYDERYDIRVEKWEGLLPEALAHHPYRNWMWDEEPIFLPGLNV